MLLWTIVIVAVVLIVTVIALQTQKRIPYFEDAAQGLQGVATTMAILFAGYWYLYERKGEPQANTELSVTGVKVAPDLVMLHTRFAVRNLGATVLYVGDLDMRLQAIDAARRPMDAIRKLGWQDFPAQIDGKDVYDNGLLRWPTVKWFKGGGERRIEPGESDPRAVDFIADCRHTAMRVYVALTRPGDAGSWTDQADVSMVGLCAKPVGSKETLSVPAAGGAD